MSKDLWYYFSNFSREAFRFEGLPSYSVEDELPFFELYQQGIKDIPDDFNIEWLDLIKDSKTKNKFMNRVRLIPDPITEYFQFEKECGYSRSSKMGECIKFIDKSTFNKIFNGEKIDDFWLFDNEICFIMQYDSIGRFLGYYQADDMTTHKYKNLSLDLIQYASMEYQ